MVNVLPHQGRTWLEVAIVGRVRRALRLDLDRLLDRDARLLGARSAAATASRSRTDPSRRRRAAPADEPARGTDTAIIMPICAEPVERVFAGLRALWASLARTGGRDRVPPLHPLATPADPRIGDRRGSGVARVLVPRRRTASAASSTGGAARASRARAATSPTSAGAAAALPLHGDARRRQRHERADARDGWCALMERAPDVGIIQTVPTAVEPALAARAHAAVREPRLRADVRRRPATAGSSATAQYWGHNTIIRVAAVHGALRAAAPARARRRSAARSSRTTSSRRR